MGHWDVRVTLAVVFLHWLTSIMIAVEEAVRIYCDSM